MLLTSVLSDPAASLRYMERYVNDGSPSGFSESYTTSAGTAPFGPADGFRLGVVEVPEHWCVSEAAFPSWLDGACSSHFEGMVIHPDMRAHAALRHSDIRWLADTTYLAVPQASGRTVEAVGKGACGYLKLHYDGTLGRLNRRLGVAQARSAHEISRALNAAVQAGALSARFAFFAESAYRVARIPEGGGVHEWGMIYRDGHPRVSSGVRLSAVVPAFALTSRDRRCPQEPLLLEQVLLSHGSAAKDALLERLLRPLVVAYFELLTRLGLGAEFHAQNILIGFDSEANIVCIILRDLESVDKDFSLMEELGIGHRFSDVSFKGLYRTQEAYHKRHSFMFDFKLGEYLIAPIIAAGASILGVDPSRLEADLKDTVNGYLGLLPRDYFPRNVWYSYERTMIDRSTPARPYVEHYRPRFRGA